MLWDIQTLIIGGTQNWCQCVLKWNLASDPKWQPHTVGGCDTCLGALIIDLKNDTNTIKRTSGKNIHLSSFLF